MHTILIVDDDDRLRRAVARFFTRSGHEVLMAADGHQAIQAIDSIRVDLVLLDLRLPDLDGLSVLQHIKTASPHTVVVVISGQGDIRVAVDVIKAGAENFIQKPINLEALKAQIERSLEQSRDRLRLSYLSKKVADLVVGHLTHEVTVPEACLEPLALVARSPDSTVLLQGETGTGKGVLANLIHQQSERRDRDLVDVNCASLEPLLTESELFGHERGAFTDAKVAKPGLMEIANGGSLFLDEIAELGPAVQAKLLKVIEDKVFRRLGGTRNLRVDVRFIAATNVDLEAAMRRGAFRQDLYYRLSVMPIRIPPLRERPDDIMPLAYTFLRRFERSVGRRIKSVSAEAEAALRRYPWPGNVRELRNVIERAAMMEDSAQLQLRSLPQELRSVVETASPTLTREALRLDVVERHHIRRVLDLCGQNRSQAADMLGIHRGTLLRKISKYGQDA